MHQQPDEAWLASLVAAVAARAEGPADRLLAVFDVLGEQLDHGIVDRCPLEPPQHCRLWSYLAGLALQGGLVEPDRVAEQLLLLIDGAFAVAQRSEATDAARTARQIAASVIALHVRA